MNIIQSFFFLLYINKLIIFIIQFNNIHHNVVFLSYLMSL